jgi:hypothetical protein
MGLTLGASSFGFQGIGSAGGSGGSPTGYYGAFSDLTTQQFVANTITPLKLNTTDLTNGVSLQGTPQTQIKIVNTGVYNFQFSAQLNHTTGGLAVVTIWLRKNGIDIPATSTDVTIEGNNTKIVPAWNFLASASANDYFEIMVSATDDHCEIYYSGARTSPVRPALPSLIVTVTQANPTAGSGGGSNIAILNEGVVLTTAVTSIDFIGNNLHASSVGSIVSVTLDTVTPTSGGTGQTSYVTGDTLYASATNVLSKLPIGSETDILSVVSGVPAWVNSSIFTVPILVTNATNLYLLQNT